MATNDAGSASSATFNFALYRYTPSLAAAVAAVMVFAALTVAHGWRMRRAGSLYFTPFLIGGIFEIVGYAGRIWSHFDKMAIGGFVMQAILILVAPALFAASIYMILGRLIRALHAENLSLIPLRWLTKVFVIGDVISFTLQAGGGGIQAAGTLELYNVGEKVIVVGLFTQIASFSVFILTAFTFHRRLTKWSSLSAVVPWRRHLCVLYATSLLILVRSVFRVVEYLQGNDGYIISHEIYLYIFDAVLMAIAMLVLTVWYIGDLQPGPIKFRCDSARHVHSRTPASEDTYHHGQATELKSLV